MIEIVWEPKQQIKDWVCNQIKQPTVIEEPFSAFGVVKDGQAIGGAVFNEYRQLPHGNQIEMTIAGKPGELWLTPRTIKAAMLFVFVTLNCVRLEAGVHMDNKASINIIEKFGFTKEGVLRDRWGPGQDVWIYSMLRHECKIVTKELAKFELEQRKGKIPVLLNT